jgi:hypothetical protein
MHKLYLLISVVCAFSELEAEKLIQIGPQQWFKSKISWVVVRFNRNKAAIAQNLS